MSCSSVAGLSLFAKGEVKNLSNFSFFQNVFKVIQTLVFNQGTKSHFNFVGMPLCSQRLKLFPVVQHFFNVTCCHSSPFISLTFWYTSVIKSDQLMLSGVSLLAVSKVNNPVGLVGLPYVMWSAHFFVTHIQTEKISSWNGPTIHVCCFMLARASTKTFISRIHIR